MKYPKLLSLFKWSLTSEDYHAGLRGGYFLASLTYSKKNSCTNWLIYFSLYDHDFYYMWWLLKEPFVLTLRRTV